MTTSDDHDFADEFPRARIGRIVEPIARFLHVEAASGVVLLVAAVAALVLANSPLSDGFLDWWKTSVSVGFGSFVMDHSLKHWVSDGLMAIFFFVIGLEVKRELVLGQLRDLRQAVLPLAGALGGMAVPALIYLSLTAGTPEASGWGIPMATDIAFVVGCMAVLGSRVPRGLRVLLLSIAIADDIGAILVIAIGYSTNLDLGMLALGLVGIGVVVLFERLGVRRVPVYVVVGAAVWVCFHESGVHATIAGVLLGLLTPTRAWVGDGMLERLVARAGDVFRGGPEVSPTLARRFETAARESVSPLVRLETTLHPWSAFVIMPVFALANAGVPIAGGLGGEPVAGAVAAGLVLGKPIGILAACAVVVRLGLARLPEGVDWPILVGGGLLSGIGFTMSLFIAGLALTGDTLDAAKVGVLGASLVAGLAGMAVLVWRLPKQAG